MDVSELESLLDELMSRMFSKAVTADHKYQYEVAQESYRQIKKCYYNSFKLFVYVLRAHCI